MTDPGRRIGSARVGSFGIRPGPAAATLAAALLACLVFAGSARADLCVTSGDGAGECSSPDGVAADTETGRVFVADEGNNRVNAFQADGTFLFAFGWGVATGAAAFEKCTGATGCQAGSAGGGAGQFDGPTSLALDNAAGSADRHSLYVFDSANRRVQKFDPDGEFLWMVGKGVNSGSSGKPNLCTDAGPPTDVCGPGGAGTEALEFREAIGLVAVGGPGTLHVSDMKKFNEEPRIQRIDGDGGFLGECEPARNDRMNAGLAVDSTGDIYAGFNLGGGVFKFEWAEPICPEAGAPYPLDPPIDSLALAVGPGDQLLASQREPRAFGGIHQTVARYDPSGAIERRFGYDEIGSNLRALASLPGVAGNVFASEPAADVVHHLEEPPPGPIGVPSSLAVASIGVISATIEVEANPEGEETEVLVEYVDQQSYEADIGDGGNGFEGPNTRQSPPAPLGAGFAVQGAQVLAGCEELAEGGCLQAETEYRYRARATNASGEWVYESPDTFQTPEHIEAIFAAEVATDTARLGARIDPLGLPTSGYMEYVEGAAYLKDLDEGGDGFAAAAATPQPPALIPSHSTATGDLSAATATGDLSAATGTGNLTSGSAFIGGVLAETGAFTVGQRISGAGIPAGTTVVAVGPETLALSASATAGGAGVALSAGSARITGLAIATGAFAVGQSISGPGIPAGAKVTALGEGTLTLSAPVTAPGASVALSAGSALITDFTHTDGSFAVGQPIEGPGIPPETEVAALGEGTLTLTQLATEAGADVELSAPSGPREFSGQVSGLAPDTTYRYRAVVEDPVGETVGERVGSFRTFGPEAPTEGCPNDPLRRGAAAFLPDCRGYEMVSPIDKEGGEIAVKTESFTGEPARLDQASSGGGRLTYGSYRAFADPLSAPLTSQYLARRGGEGWESHSISPPQDGLIKEAVKLDNEFRHFSADLCEGWLSAFAEYPEDVGQVPGFFNLYRRADRLCGEERFTPVSTGAPKAEDPNAYNLELQGVSEDGEVAAFVATDALAGTAAPTIVAGDRQLYVKEAGGELRFVCILPGGTPSASACSAGTGRGALANLGNTRQASVTNALSADGRSLYWTDASANGQLYLRTNPLGEGAECSGEAAPCTVAVSAGTAQFWAAAADGSAAIYTTGAGTALEGANAELRRYEAESGESTPIAGAVNGVVGISEDATRVYFVSRHALDPEPSSQGATAAEGEPNLYLYDAATAATRYLATVSDADADPFPATRFASSAVAVEPLARSARVTADGEQVAFMSSAPLTGYDNTDASSGAANTEVFVYDAASDELVCGSCNPSGGRPTGRNGGQGGEFWIAARLPVYETTMYAPRVLSEDGERLFFEAADSLVARDTNGRIDIYQWERTGRGDCETGSQAYVEASRGCIELISSGKGDQDAGFVDASPTGDDVFFTTAQSLYAADPGLVDIYDARVEGGFEPPPPPTPECEGQKCQAPAPPPPAFVPPISQSFVGPGNLAPSVRANRCSRSARKARALSRRAKRLRHAVGSSKAPAAKRKRIRGARRSANRARRLSRNAKRCRARARATARRLQR